MNEPEKLPELKDLRGIYATDNPPKRYEHKCKRCGQEFSNVVKDSEFCAVCTVRNLRDEWE